MCFGARRKIGGGSQEIPLLGVTRATQFIKTKYARVMHGRKPMQLKKGNHEVPFVFGKYC